MPPQLEFHRGASELSSRGIVHFRGSAGDSGNSDATRQKLRGEPFHGGARRSEPCAQGACKIRAVAMLFAFNIRSSWSYCIFKIVQRRNRRSTSLSLSLCILTSCSPLDSACRFRYQFNLDRNSIQLFRILSATFDDIPYFELSSQHLICSNATQFVHVSILLLSDAALSAVLCSLQNANFAALQRLDADQARSSVLAAIKGSSGKSVPNSGYSLCHLRSSLHYRYFRSTSIKHMS